MLSYRLINEASLSGRSHCTQCTQTIAAYDLIPVFSFCQLKGKCRWCKSPISPLYPCIEILTCILFMGISFFIPTQYWLGTGIFFSALIIIIRSDLEYMLISQYTTLFLVPIGFLLSALDRIPISLSESLLGAGLGYGFLWAIGSLFSFSRGKEGIGEGDLDLLCLIGAFTGPLGCMLSLAIGSITASIISICYVLINYLITKKLEYDIKIPFGPFLAFGAIVAVFQGCCILSLLYGY